MIFKTKSIFWEENEKAGYRHISVEHNERVLITVVSHRTDGVWNSTAVPMGFSFTKDEIIIFTEIISVLPNLMTFLCTDEISTDEIQQYLLTLKVL